MKTVLYSHGMGEGIIVENANGNIFQECQFDFKCRRESPIVAGEKLEFGKLTSMSGYFKRELIFCGVMDECSLVFFIGSESDMFSSTHYYQVVHLIGEFRLFSMFTPNAGRDFNFVNGIWK